LVSIGFEEITTCNPIIIGTDYMNSLLRATILFVLYLVVFPSTGRGSEDFIKANPESNKFINYFFVPGYVMKRKQTKEFVRDGQYIADLSIQDASNNCNKSKSYCLHHLPGFEIVTKKGGKVVKELEPDHFVDLLDLKAKKVQRVAQSGSPGIICGTNWVSELAFTVYGLEKGDGFVTIIDLGENKETYYSISRRFRKQGASQDAFLIEKYGRTKP
jgi:hypothetical protein